MTVDLDELERRARENPDPREAPMFYAAALAELIAHCRDLEQRQPVCAICGKPATCIGAYEGERNLGFGCNDCCGHGNEDGWCVDACPTSVQTALMEAAASAVDAEERAYDLEQQLDRYKRALADAISSAALDAPYSGAYRDAAWERADRILRGEEK